MASLKDADIYLILPITMFCFLPQNEPGYILYKIIYFDFRPLVGWHKKKHVTSGNSKFCEIDEIVAENRRLRNLRSFLFN